GFVGKPVHQVVWNIALGKDSRSGRRQANEIGAALFVDSEESIKDRGYQNCAKLMRFRGVRVVGRRRLGGLPLSLRVGFADRAAQRTELLDPCAELLRQFAQEILPGQIAASPRNLIA